MHAEIITVGTEITSGDKLDTNSQWLSRELSEIGVAARYHTSVADDLTANVEVFRIAIERADVVLVTGGLGPTLDDLTREALAVVLGAGLVEDRESLAAIEAIFTRRGRQMPPSNRVQALFPEGTTAIPNPIGTAPGIWCEVPRLQRSPCRLAAMPGVPSEMKRMYKQEIEPRLTADRCIRRTTINCFGLGESQTEELLGDLTRRGRDPEIGITAHEATISLRIIAHAATPEECQIKLDAAAAEIEARLAGFVIGRGDEDVEHVVVRLLREGSHSLATLEVATGGNLASRLAAVGESAGVCRGGIVLASATDCARWLETARRRLNLTTSNEAAPDGRLTRHVLARRLADAVRQDFGAEYGLAVTPWEDLVAATGQPPVPTAWAALADASGACSVEARQTGNPAIFAARTSKSALDLLRRKLLHLPQLD